MSDFDENFEKVRTLFDKDVCQQGTNPLKGSAQIAIYLDDAGPVLLTKRDGKAIVLKEAPSKADMTFWITSQGLDYLRSQPAGDVGEVGVAILQLMASDDPKLKMRAKVHIGLFDLVLKGYLGVIPLGGPTVMKFLASKGFTGMGKIKDAISKFKE